MSKKKGKQLDAQGRGAKRCSRDRVRSFCVFKYVQTFDRIKMQQTERTYSTAYMHATRQIRSGNKSTGNCYKSTNELITGENKYKANLNGGEVTMNF